MSDTKGKFGTVVLALRSNGQPTLNQRLRSGALTQVLGSDGRGEYVFVIRGDIEKCHERARDLLRKYESYGHKIDSAIIVGSDATGYCEPYFNVINLD